MKSEQAAEAARPPPLPPSKPPSSAAALFVLFVLVPVLAVSGALLFAAHRPTVVHPLPPPVVERLLPVLNAVRARVLQKGAVPSTPMWNRARQLMATSFAPVRSIVPGTNVSHIWREPLVTFFDDYLSDAEIDLLIGVAEPKFKKSQVVQPDGSVKEDPARTSDTAWIYPKTNAEVDALVLKLSKLAGFPPQNAEALAVNRYRVAQYFAPHHDYLSEAHLRNTGGDFNGCQRTATVLLYLSDVAAGGETMFVRNGTMDRHFKYEPDNPDHLAVRPRRGRVLVWFDMHPHTERIDKRTMHGGAPVKEGVKIAATLFLRNCTSDLFKEKKPAADAPAEGTKQEL